MIRAAKNEDVGRLVELGQQLHDTSDYVDIPFNSEKVAALLNRLIEGAGVVFIAEIDGRIVGGFAGGVTDYWFSDELVGFDYSFFIEPSSRNGITAMKLIAAFKNWCKAKGARHLKVGITTGINVERTTEFYLSMGFNNAGTLFSMEL